MTNHNFGKLFGRSARKPEERIEEFHVKILLNSSRTICFNNYLFEYFNKYKINNSYG